MILIIIRCITSRIILSYLREGQLQDGLHGPHITPSDDEILISTQSAHLGERYVTLANLLHGECIAPKQILEKFTKFDTRLAHVSCVYFCEQYWRWDDSDIWDTAPQLLVRRIFPTSHISRRHRVQSWMSQELIPALGGGENNIRHVVDACEMLAREVCYRAHTSGRPWLGHDAICRHLYEEIRIHSHESSAHI